LSKVAKKACVWLPPNSCFLCFGRPGVSGLPLKPNGPAV